MYHNVPMLLFLSPFSSPLELYGRQAIRSSKRISNPGCYATSSQLIIAPLVKNGLIIPGIWPTVFGTSGYSGAGTIAGATDPDGKPATVPKVTPESLNSATRPYALTDHIHEREAGRHLGTLLGLGPDSPTFKVNFIPSVGPWFSGIISVLSAPLNAKVTAKEIKRLYEEMYKGERLITVMSGVPSIHENIENKQGWTVGGFQVHSEGDRVVIVGGLDNLLKGAATQCLQNLNLSLGYDEYAGIPITP